MKSATTLLLTLGSIAAAAAASDISEASSTTAEIEGAPRLFHQPDTAEDEEEHRDLLRSESSCFTLRFNGDSNTKSHNSFKLEDVSAGKTLIQRGVGQLQNNVQEDFPSADEPCLKPTLGNKLKLTVTDSNGELNGGFFAWFVGGLRVDRVEGQMGQEYVKCFKMQSGSPGFESLDLSECGMSATEAAAATTSGFVEVSKANPSPSPPAPTATWVSTLCPSGQKKIKVEFTGDKYVENSWLVKNKSTGSTVLQSKDYDSECSSSNWQSCNKETVEKCLPVNQDFELIFKDKIGDKPPGFRLHMERSGGVWEEQWGSPLFGKEWTLAFHTGTVSMSQRDKKWLDAHNKRRAKYWFEDAKLKTGNNPHYLPLKWDTKLANRAAAYAIKLLDDCDSNTMVHDKNRGGEGENMSKNRGASNSSYGQMPDSENILNRFVEMELDLPYGKRYHMTQVLWQGSAYVGCGDAYKKYLVNGKEHMCHTQVCRYISPGNCDVNGDSGSSNYDLKRIMLDSWDQNCGNKYPETGFYTM
jgi:hypothetical protein